PGWFGIYPACRLSFSPWCQWSCRLLLRDGVEQTRDQFVPRAFGGGVDLQGTQHERPHGERQAEAREDVGIERGIDRAVVLRPVDDVDEHAFARVESVT